MCLSQSTSGISFLSRLFRAGGPEERAVLASGSVGRVPAAAPCNAMQKWCMAETPYSQAARSASAAPSARRAFGPDCQEAIDHPPVPLPAQTSRMPPPPTYRGRSPGRYCRAARSLPVGAPCSRSRTRSRSKASQTAFSSVNWSLWRQEPRLRIVARRAGGDQELPSPRISSSSSSRHICWTIRAMPSALRLTPHAGRRDLARVQLRRIQVGVCP